MKDTKKIFTSFLKWRYKHISQKNFLFILSVLVGFIAGLAAVTIKNITHYIEWILDKGIVFSQNQLYFVLPTIGLLLVYLYMKFILRKPMRNSISTILYSLSRKQGDIKTKNIYVPLITAPLTVGFGGSVGLLGPAVASGAAISSNLAALFHSNPKTKSLLIACASAGAIASIFKAPIAAIIFAVEVFSLDLTLVSLLPLLFASISGVLTSYFFTGNENLFNFKTTDPFAIQDTLFYILLGIGTAFASVYFTRMYFGINRLFKHLHRDWHRLLVGGIIIGSMLYFIPPLYGEGLSFIDNLMRGDHITAIGKTPLNNYMHNIWIVVLLLGGITVFKAVAMTLTFAAGGYGGIFIPTLVMGSALGNIIAKIINQIGFQVSESNFTLVGMAGLITGVLHAPLTAIFLIAEISGGYSLFVPLMITAAISYSITKRFCEHSIYTQGLAEIGALITHDKDHTVLTIMKLDNVIETNFIQLHPDMPFGEMLHQGVSKSSRNLFPVVDSKKQLIGILLLDDIRDSMFKTEQYNSTTVSMYMTDAPDVIVYERDSMKSVMQKFQDSGAWNLPVIKNGKYHGFVSKSKMLTVYRRELINVTQ
ncbi:MAG: chloride channel protein [Flavobacteriaceae bacterium]|nr:chloride channel protein [Flavobacteriaceae bacterium]